MPTELVKQSVDLIRRLAPLDLEGQGLYVIDFEAWNGVGGADLANGRCHGWYRTGLDLTLQDELKQRGEWVGRGAAFVVKYSPGKCYIDTAVHELAHWLDDDHALLPANEFPAAELSTVNELTQTVPSINDTAGSFLDCFKADARYESRDPEYLKQLEKALLRWQSASAKEGQRSHQLRWHRAALHLCWRANQNGHPTTPPLMTIGGDTYGVSCGMDYYRILRDDGEFQRCRDMPIREVVNTPPPEPFTELWKRDTTSTEG